MQTEAQRIAQLPADDAPYTWGRPSANLSTRQLARLTIWRSRLSDSVWTPDTDGEYADLINGPAVLAMGHAR